MINHFKLVTAIIFIATGWFQLYAQPLSTPDLVFFEVKGNVKTISYMNDYSEVNFNINGFLDIEDVHIKRDVNNRLIELGDTKIKWGKEHISEIYMNYTCTQFFYNNKGLCARIVSTQNEYMDVRQDVVDVIYNKFDDYGNWIMRTAINIKTGEKKTERRFITYYSNNELSVKHLDTDNCNVVREYKNEVIVEEKKPELEQVFTAVEQMPQFPGGDTALTKYLSSNINYPIVAAKNGIQGRVVVQFVVTKNGSVGEVKVLRSVDRDLDKEAIRLCKSLPKFIPGKMNGQAVNVWYTMPITFKLQGLN